jgi:hypothetical protein
MHKEEIPFAEIDRYAPELLCALDSVCESPAFRTSPKSCEFLRHIVRHTLHGDVDELKERLIGITLLGRETTYDTGSDAGVRVRANDVRKRLSAYTAAIDGTAEFTLDLPVGSYIPRFFHSASPLELQTASAAILPAHNGQIFGRSTEENKLDGVPPLSIRQLIAPTLVALFLCTIFIRWQLAQEHPFVTFWQTVLQDHQAILHIPAFPIDGRQAVSIANMGETAQLLNLAGQFHSSFTLTNAPALPQSPAEIIVSIGSAPSTEQEAHGEMGLAASSSQGRFAMENTPGGKAIIDRDGSKPHLLTGRAALLTIINGPERSIQIDGTDDAAIGSLIQTLCERGSFPDELADSLQSGTATQMVFPMTPHAETMFFHETLSATSAMTAQPR